MVTITLTLTCDDCKRPFASPANEHCDILMRRDIEALRTKAHNKGWRRFRPKNTAPNGDYCPKCQAVILASKK